VTGDLGCWIGADADGNPSGLSRALSAAEASAEATPPVSARETRQAAYGRVEAAQGATAGDLPDALSAQIAPLSSVAPLGQCEATGVFESRGGDPGAVLDPAERLRRAADELARRAAAATPGPWRPEYAIGTTRVQAVFIDCPDEQTCENVDCYDGTQGIGGFDAPTDNEWALLLGPQVAAPLAAWLRAEADRPERGAWDDQVLVKATALADQILGEATR
jgi:hypothetical protein